MSFTRVGVLTDAYTGKGEDQRRGGYRKDIIMMVSRGINAASWSLRVTRADTQRALRAQGYTCWKEVSHFYLYCKGSEKMRTVLGNNVERVKGSVVRDSKFSEHSQDLLGGIPGQAPIL